MDRNQVILQKIRALAIKPGELLVIHTDAKLDAKQQQKLERDIKGQLLLFYPPLLLNGKFIPAKWTPQGGETELGISAALFKYTRPQILSFIRDNYTKEQVLEAYAERPKDTPSDQQPQD